MSTSKKNKPNNKPKLLNKTLMKTINWNLLQNKLKITGNDEEYSCSFILVRINIKKKVTYFTIDLNKGKITEEDHKSIKHLETILKYIDVLCKKRDDFNPSGQGVDTNRYSILLFSQNPASISISMPRATAVTNLKQLFCGLVFLNHKSNKSIYLSLMCSKKGLDGNLLLLGEEIGRILRYKEIHLKSLEEPYGFYLYKGYKNKIGKNTIKLNTPFKNIPSSIAGKIKPMNKLGSVKIGLSVKQVREIFKKTKSKYIPVITGVVGTQDNGILMGKKL